MSSSTLGHEPEHTPEPSNNASSPMSTAAKIALAVLLTGELMNILDDSVVLTAMPTLQRSLGAGSGVPQWLTAGTARRR
ncbi:hypothetical protein F5X71_21400 [Nocardia brasiliensis]|uniref:Uncharacterized protein n=1 Tax=Nocardia brasiliensis TaxID=37326 RepID=A0A6G9XUF7_NOCBR|nr:multidrug efflux MFS transporter [Nocardia brasiliensis]QIS04545.1 hypothetical protein F5X71_21400 [Nocardia brasiliensis]